MTQHQEPRKTCCHEGLSSWLYSVVHRPLVSNHTGTQFLTVRKTKDKVVVRRTCAVAPQAIFCMLLFSEGGFSLCLYLTPKIKLSTLRLAGLFFRWKQNTSDLVVLGIGLRILKYYLKLLRSSVGVVSVCERSYCCVARAVESGWINFLHFFTGILAVYTINNKGARTIPWGRTVICEEINKCWRRFLFMIKGILDKRSESKNKILTLAKTSLLLDTINENGGFSGYTKSLLYTNYYSELWPSGWGDRL